nr:glycoside hydrolase family 2 TIM barrel-domain containing protein [Bacteroides sp. 224]
MPYWKDLNVLSVNKELPRTAFMSYQDAESASQMNYALSNNHLSLNGVWKFYFVDDYRKLPDNVAAPGLNLSDWHEIKVPGNWELQGFGEAFYVNTYYEFATHNPVPPLLPENNPVGVYRTDFLYQEEQWKDKDVYLHIAGAKSGVYVYVNGKEVGYSEDSKDPAEFNITSYLNPGKNELTIKIFRWSTGSWLECQDFLRVSGIERDVFIWAQPKTAIRDFVIKPTLDDTYTNGLFTLNMLLKNGSEAKHKLTVKYELQDKSGKAVLSGSKEIDMINGENQTVTFDGTIPAVATWTAEHPNLYQLLMTVEEGGKVLEVVPFRVGFRKIELKTTDIIVNKKPLKLFYINGQPIKFKGVNIHETTEDGHYITPEQMRRNFELMKLNNINAVRLSHYPQDRKFYEMCDEFGLYVYDEANIESHGMGYTIHQDDMRKGAAGHIDGRKRGTLGHNPDFKASHLSRIQNMFQRNKNHASVTIWSLGNEGGNGFNFYEAYTMLKDADRDLMNRPVCYERALEEWNTDMIVPQYPSAGAFEYYGKNGRRVNGTDNRPFIPSEYAHAMGNSTGSLYEQWEQVYKYPNLQGGFIWEWIDHAVKIEDAEGRPFWAYGGDFGVNQASDGNFVADGIINPDQNPHPAMAEVKYVYQNVGFEAVDLSKGEIKIKNRFYFTNLSDYRVKYKLLENGKKISEGLLALNVEPQDSVNVNIPVAKLKAKPGIEYFLNFEVTSKKAEQLVPAGHLVAYDQFELPIKAEKPALKNTNGPALYLIESNDILSVTSSKVSFVFDKKQGIVSSYKVGSQEYFAEGFGIQPNFWRGPNDNDYGHGMPKRTQVWKQSSKNFKIADCSVKMEGKSAVLTVNYALAAGNNYIVKYTVYPSGVVHASLILTPVEAAEIPRIGVRFRLPATMNQVQYLGRGPEENYADRYKGTLVGLYKTTAEEMYYPYVRPQENGHHTDTRWLSLNTPQGKGLLIEGDTPIGFNALHNSVEDFDCEESDADYQWTNMSEEQKANHDVEKARNVLRKQTHEYDIVPRDFVEVCLDLKQYGVGGYDSWGAKPEPAYTIYPNKEYSWGFTLKPL